MLIWQFAVVVQAQLVGHRPYFKMCWWRMRFRVIVTFEKRAVLHSCVAREKFAVLYFSNSTVIFALCLYHRKLRSSKIFCTV